MEHIQASALEGYQGPTLDLGLGLVTERLVVRPMPMGPGRGVARTVDPGGGARRVRCYEDWAADQGGGLI